MNSPFSTLAPMVVMLGALYGVACSGTGASAALETSGGAVGVGGTLGSGGSNTGGFQTTASGGTIAATGGRSPTGGTTNTGGRIATGGALATGGNVATGGTATGGMLNTGGHVAFGGAPATGGTSVQGGNSSTGGVAGASTSYPVSTGTPTIYLAGDSTVSTYTTAQAPQQGWGQRLSEFFTNDVIIVNDAIGGRSSKSFIDEGHLTAILAIIKSGDYLFAQWGINDRYTSDPTRYTDPATTFRTYMQQYIDGARSKNAIAVIITPTPRLDYTNGVFHNDYTAYCTADFAVAAATNTPIIDLQTMGLAYYTSIGYDAVVNTITLNGNVLHFQANGAYEMARLVAQGVQQLGLPISKFVIQAKLDAG